MRIPALLQFLALSVFVIQIATADCESNCAFESLRSKFAESLEKNMTWKLREKGLSQEDAERTVQGLLDEVTECYLQIMVESDNPAQAEKLNLMNGGMSVREADRRIIEQFGPKAHRLDDEGEDMWTYCVYESFQEAGLKLED